MMDNMKKRLDTVCLALFGKRLDEIEVLHKSEVSRVTVPIVKAQTGDNVLAKVMAEQERMKVQLEEAATAKRRLEKIEKEMEILRQARDEAKIEAEAWRQEAIRPGSKRGCVALSTPSAQATMLPRFTPTKTPAARVDYKELKELHQMEVDKLKELRLLELNGRREAEQEQEFAKQKIVEMEAGRTGHIPRSNLRERLDEVVAGSGKGKKKSVTQTPIRFNDREAFIKETRKSMSQTNDKLMVICVEEGIKHVTIGQSIDEIVAQRVLQVLPPATIDSIEVFDDLAGNGSSKEAGGDSTAF
ncbi:hypothetical protein CBR_g31634 [Chara braunii]|uniref:Uncharacterized protein n=1 Tax=Chara braunii TaxID=69332 RepID=A0A388LFI9_CHABU|nr:hypothetical protein CBR_g31634 [Chara braunii]|eukprot:GBG81076.1 hypothetical protein CBR_g31634 [Chara braunii]